MRKRLTLAGLIIIIIGVGGWILFNVIGSYTVKTPEASFGWLVLFLPVTAGAVILGTVGIILLILGLVLKNK